MFSRAIVQVITKRMSFLCIAVNVPLAIFPYLNDYTLPESIGNQPITFYQVITEIKIASLSFALNYVLLAFLEICLFIFLKLVILKKEKLV